MLLRRLADRTGLTHHLATALPAGQSNRWRDRVSVLTTLAIAIVLGARNLSDTERLGAHQSPLMGAPASDTPSPRPA